MSNASGRTVTISRMDGSASASIEVNGSVVSVITGYPEEMSDDDIFTAISAPTAPPDPNPVPERITRFQAYAALLSVSPGQDGDPTMYHSVQRKLSAAKDTSPSAMFSWLAWSSASEFFRSGVLINGMAAGFALSGPALDTIFRAAALIEA